MSFPPTLALATRNAHKIREIVEICRDWPVEWVTAPDARAADVTPDPWPDVEETGQTYLENALLKARAVAVTLGIPAVADDSGLEVDALGGAPGPRSARFAAPEADDGANLRLLVDRVRSTPAQARTARYRCVAACAWPDGREVWADGMCQGAIVLEPRGTGGFGYDPIFVPAGEARTMAELDPQEKNAISHRGKALRALGDRLGGMSPD